MRFEIEVELDAEIYEYIVAFELPETFKQPRVFEESLSVGGKPLYTRKTAQVYLAKDERTKQINAVPSVQQWEAEGTAAASLVQFRIDWHLVALPIIQERSSKDPLSILKQWLARMLILAPLPSPIAGDSESETLGPDVSMINFGAWFSGLLAHSPAAYVKIDEYLRQVMVDFKDLKNPVIGRDSRKLEVQFATDQGSLTLPFADLSDGEKCFMICAVVLASAAADVYRPAFCFWDEPDSYLAPDEVQHFVLNLRRAFQSGGQFIATSHNPEAIRSFSDANTLVLFRKNHFEPTIVRQLDTLHIHGDLVDALTRGDVEP